MSRRDGAIFCWRVRVTRKVETTAVLFMKAESSVLMPVRRRKAHFSSPTRILPERRCNSGERSITTETSNSTTSVASAGLVKLARNASVLTRPPSMKAAARVKKATAGLTRPLASTVSSSGRVSSTNQSTGYSSRLGEGNLSSAARRMPDFAADGIRAADGISCAVSAFHVFRE